MALHVIGLCAFVAASIVIARFVQHQLKTAPAFAIDAITLKGLTRLDRAELLRTAGIDLGTNVFVRSPEEVRARLLHHPWIVSAEVQRRLPSRFEIAIQERAPVALLVVEACADAAAGSVEDGHEDALADPNCEEASSLYLVSSEGKLFKRLRGRDPVDLPVITGVTRQRFASEPELPQRVLAHAVALMQEYRVSGLGEHNTIEEIHVEPNDGFSLYIGEDLTYVRLGLAPFTQKLRRMKKVFERLEREQARAEYIYLDNEQRPDRVVVRLR